MSTSPVGLLALLAQPPGDVLYFVFGALVLGVALFVSAVGRGRAAQMAPTPSRMTSSLGAALGAWSVVALGAGFALLSGEPANAVLPPLELGVLACVLLLLMWGFVGQLGTRWRGASNTLLVVALLLVILAYTVVGMQWPSEAADGSFARSGLGFAWGWILAGLALAGAAGLVAGRTVVADVPLKVVVLALIGIGGLALAISGTIGALRLCVVAALAVLPLVAHRGVVRALRDDAHRQMDENRRWLEALAAAQASRAQAENGTPLERESVQLLRTLGLILEEAQPAEIPLRVVRAATEVLKADVGVLLHVNDANYADIVLGWDRALGRETRTLDALNLSQQPTLVNAVDRAQQRPLFPDRNPDELSDLYARLDVDEVGPAYIQPLLNDGALVAVLLIALPYVKRELREAERELLKGIAIIAGSLLALSYAADNARQRAEERAIQAVLTGQPPDAVGDDQVLHARQALQANLEAAQQHNAALTEQISTLKLQLDDERSRLTTLLGTDDEGLSITQRIVALNDEHERIRDERNRLAQRLQQAETTLISAQPIEDEVLYRTVIETLRREKNALDAEREALAAQLAELRSGRNVPLPEGVRDMVRGMGEEKTRLEAERNLLAEQLTTLEAQLAAAGIPEGTEGLGRVVQQLLAQRLTLQARTEALRVERDALLNERKRLETRIRREQEREAQLVALEAELRHAVADREAMLKQRDTFRRDRDDSGLKLTAAVRHSAQLQAAITRYQQELQEVQDEQRALRAQLQAATESLAVHEVAQELAGDNVAAEGVNGMTPTNDVAQGAALLPMLRALDGQREALERELAATRAELDAQRARAVGGLVPTEGPTLDATSRQLAENIRAPLDAIASYVNALLNESAGILGDTQRRFLNRVAANVYRLEQLADDLARLSRLEQGLAATGPQDVVAVIEDALTENAWRFHEKALSVVLDLADDLPLVPADGAALADMVGTLLSGVALAVPAESQLQVRAALLPVQLKDSGSGSVMCVVVQVTGETSGAPNATLPIAEAALSVARAFAAQHGGRLWRNPTADGQSETLAVALPLAGQLTP